MDTDLSTPLEADDSQIEIFPSDLRQFYLEQLQAECRRVQYDYLLDRERTYAVRPTTQNLLYRLAARCHADQQDTQVPFSELQRSPLLWELMRLEKCYLMPLIGSVIGHRPDCRSFDPVGDHETADKAAMAAYISAALEHNAVYLKGNLSGATRHTARLTRTDHGEYCLETRDGQRWCHELELLLRDWLETDRSYLVEYELPIARTGPPPEGAPWSDNSTWELRTIPPHHREGHAKVNPEGKGIKPVDWYDLLTGSLQVIESVYRRDRPDLSADQLTIKAQTFINRCRELSDQVKQLTDQLAVQIARQFLCPSDFPGLDPSDPRAFETLLQTCFAGTFLIVDISGVWQDGELQPVIIEAQTRANLTEEEAHEVNRISLLRQFNMADRLLTAMRPRRKPVGRKKGWLDWVRHR